MARIVGYIASSLDGYIATEDDKLDWLFKYGTPDSDKYGYQNFIQRIRTVVMGRGTYDVIAAGASRWAYDDKRVIVVSSSNIPTLRGKLETRPDVDALITELRGLDDGDVWMLGGGKLQMAFLERGALDEIEIFVIPELLGGGRPLFPPVGYMNSPELLSARSVGDGCVRLHYAFRR